MQLLAGSYTLTVSAPGFERYEEKDLVFSSSERAVVRPITLDFKWHEGTRLIQFRFETYNTFNHTQFGAPSGTGTSIDTVARFDASGKQVNGRFGQFLATRDGRRIQLGLKFSF